MRKTNALTFQIGKNGLTKTSLDHLASAFKNHKVIKVQLLKSSSEREKIKEMAENLVKELPGEYSYRIIGFTIVMKRKGVKNNKKPSNK